MIKVIKPRRLVRNPNQIPLIVPDSSWERPKELPDLTRVDEFALDTETKDDGLARGRGPGWAYGAGYVAGVSVAWRQGELVKAAYIPMAHPDTENFDRDAVQRWLKMVTRKRRVIYQNAPYDIGWLSTDMGIEPPSLIDDVGCMAVMIDESADGYDLDSIARRLGLEGKDERLLREAADAYGYNPNKPSEVKQAIAKMPARYGGIYAEQDAVATLLSAEYQRPLMEEQDLVRAYTTEMDLIPLVHAMRRRGIRLDVEGCERHVETLKGWRDATLAELTRRIGGRTIGMEDVRSHIWLQNTFENMGVEYAKEEEEGRSKNVFDKNWMRQGYVGRYEAGRQGHWLPQLLARAKQCDDAQSKFLTGFLLKFAHNGRIHANINQFMSEDGGTRTHRFSYSDPPLQQMPSRPEIFLREWTLTADIAKMIRSCFLPERGEKWFSPDYSQQEYRLIVHYAALMGMRKADAAIEKYLSDPKTDFHNLVVEMTGLIRQRAKDTNFAKSYGAGKHKFADMTGMTVDEAVATMKQYDDEMPFVKLLNERCDKAAQERGYIVMLDGARMHFNTWETARYMSWEDKRDAMIMGWKLNACGREEALERVRMKGHPWFSRGIRRANTRKAMNSLIQGGSARMCKMAMVDLWRAGYIALLQIHDELPHSVGKEKDGKIIAEIMRSVGEKFDALLPFRVDEEYGINWADAKHPWKEAKYAK